MNVQLYITNIIGDESMKFCYIGRMRRLLVAVLFVASGLGIYMVPAGADSSTLNSVILSFDFSDNGSPASASGGPYTIVVDVLPESTPGIVRMVAVAPDDSGVNNLVCKFQDVSQSTASCDFNFTAAGTWHIHAQYAVDHNSDVSATAVTNIRVGY